jgi:hypothetical protein
MAIPEATLTIRDGALGVALASFTGVSAKVGCCSSGTAYEVVEVSNQQTLIDTFGRGPLVEAVAHQLAVAGGPVLCCKSPSSTAGAASAVTPVGTGTSVMTVTGAALDAYQAIVLIVQAGASLAALTATFKYSLDNGRTYSAEIAMPVAGVYAVPNTGLTLTFAAGTFVAADTYTFTSTGPSSTLVETMLAVDAVLADSQQVFNIHVLGIPADLTAAAALFSALDTKMSSAATTLFRYLYSTMELPVATDAAIKAAFLSLSSTRVEVAAGFLNLSSAINGSAYNRPAGWVSTARAAAVVPSEDLGRVATGPCKGVVALTRDEYQTSGLDVARFTTMRTHVGRQGSYLTSGRILAATGSDFQLIQHRRVMDLASATVRNAQLEYLNDSVRVDATTGLILETDARTIDAKIEGAMRAAVSQPGYASEVSALVDRTVDILSTQTLRVKYRVTPLGYAKTIDGEIGFFNPALQPV